MVGTAMLAPAFAMVGLTYAVWIRLYVTRIGEMKRRRIHPQSIALSGQAASRLEDTRAADNFRNLFELPVLLYVAVVVAILGGVVTPVSLGLAWAFVLLRVVHSAIHCTYNKVMHRFASYLAGGVVLALLWAYLAVAIAW
jgi:hypothetical protein